MMEIHSEKRASVFQSVSLLLQLGATYLRIFPIVERHCSSMLDSGDKAYELFSHGDWDELECGRHDHDDADGRACAYVRSSLRTKHIGFCSK